MLFLEVFRETKPLNEKKLKSHRQHTLNGIYQGFSRKKKISNKNLKKISNPSKKSHRQHTLAPRPAHGIEGPRVGGDLKIFELVLPVVVHESPLQRPPGKLHGLPDLDGFRIPATKTRKKLDLKIPFQSHILIEKKSKQ